MLTEFVSVAKEFGLVGLFFAVVVLALIYIARLNGLVVDGKWARVANVTLSVILAGLNPLNPEIENALVAIIASLGSALMYEFITWASAKAQELKAVG